MVDTIESGGKVVLKERGGGGFFLFLFFLNFFCVVVYLLHCVSHMVQISTFFCCIDYHPHQR